MLVTIAQALKAKEFLKEKLDRPEWLRGISIRYEIGIGHYLMAKVREPHGIVPVSIDGVQVRTEVVGDVVDHPLDDSEARRVSQFIHEQWDFIPEQDAFEFYCGLGYMAISEGTVKTSLWVLKRVLEHEMP